MLSVLLVMHAIVLAQETPPTARSKAVENPHFQAGSKVVFPNGLIGP